MNDTKQFTPLGFLTPHSKHGKSYPHLPTNEFEITFCSLELRVTHYISWNCLLAQANDICQVSKKCKVYNEPFNNSDTFNFQSLICFGCQHPNSDLDI